MKWFASALVMAALSGGALRADEPKLTFRTLPVKKGTLTVGVLAKGTIEPEEVIDIGAQVSGQIVRFGADPADEKKTIDWSTKVNEGTVLAVLDDKKYKAAVEQAQAALALAEADLVGKKASKAQAEREWERAQKLRPSGGISQTDYDTAKALFETAQAAIGVSEASLALAKAQVNEAKVNLGYTVIKSPVKGVILDRRVNLGQRVEASLSAPSLFLIAKDLKRIQVWVSVNEADVGAVKKALADRKEKGVEARFTVEAFPGEEFHGKVTKVRLNATTTQNVVTYPVEVSVDNTDEKLLPYLTAEVLIPTGEKKDVLMIPNAALRFQPLAYQVGEKYRETFRELQLLERAALHADRPLKRSIVWVEEDGGLKPVRARLGGTDGKFTEVISSSELKEGKPVVVE